MSTDYHKMWAELGLDLKMHDALLNVLGEGYQQTFLTQKNRPEGMQYFDFVMSEVHGLRIKELRDAQAEGRVVVGSFCVFVPEELILAVDGISVGLCTGAEFGFDLAEKYLPRNTCSLIKSAFGFNLSKVCPYMESADMIVGENTCDGKKKSYEEFGKLVKNLYMMDLPQTKSASGKALLKAEYQRFQKALEELSGKKITVENLKKGIEIVNNKRKAIHRLAKLRAADPAPISGLDALLINQIYFYDNPVRFTESVNKTCDELEERISKKEGVFPPDAPRLLVSGCPMAVPNWKLPTIIEQSGAVIVGEESCVGERGTRNETVIEGNSVEELLDNIIERYFQIDCAIFTPNPDRKDHLIEMAEKYKADGVVHYSLQFCQPYDIESHNVEKELEEAEIPVLNLVTDYSAEDMGQLSTRVEAFIERIKE
ncbi:MAG: double-cubane-cluster-containing anaerobic reductase [Candidatus Cloacimonadales bacterium]|nr:double-cubane-cluster-containing anaerobic reductase [Candidatus Cloacimonadales bacterium]